MGRRKRTKNRRTCQRQSTQGSTETAMQGATTDEQRRLPMPRAMAMSVCYGIEIKLHPRKRRRPMTPSAARISQLERGEHVGAVYDSIPMWQTGKAVHDDCEILARAYVRELDERLIDEEIARTLFDKCEWEFDPRRDCLMCFHGVITLLIWPQRRSSRLLGRNYPLLDNATVGDFYTACRLFGIELPNSNDPIP